MARNDAATAADGAADDPYQRRQKLRRLLRAGRERFERQDDQRIARKDSERLAERLVNGRLPAPDCCIVETRQIVMHERGAMQKLDRAGCRHRDPEAFRLASLRYGKQQSGTNARAAREYRMTHRGHELGRTVCGRRFEHIGQRLFDTRGDVHGVSPVSIQKDTCDVKNV